mmetsp:Transcript_3404/g.6887  ORF Transcript_3404/g.6887 Transcript_3404/m.6887 type:complete len:81 (+) Transcript_3404:34-276(+)
MGGWRDEAEARRLEEVEDPQVLKRKYKSQIRSSVYDKEPNASLKSIVVVFAAIERGEEVGLCPFGTFEEVYSALCGWYSG